MKIVKKALDTSVIILDITGEITLGESAEHLSEELARLLGEPSVECVVLNMENINYMDSTGLGELVGYLTRFADTGKRLKLVRPSQTIVKLLELTRLNEVFKAYASEEQALEEALG
ncbi:MAG: STAS domain-containing protein [Acidobacteriota bacterium]